ncbi:MAG: UDP-N-acetylmuramoyl-tripeptide--D-alanyl-D-alanine ligase [Eubacteriales bacterium]|nr:UDP-N-acetylmuramoyl-tripeptide--D-alanyl-D-alanine ligase [Eubacteriales bacterium]
MAILVSLLLCALATLFYLQPLVHLFQLEGYKIRQFKRHLRQEPIVGLGLVLFVPMAALQAASLFFAAGIAGLAIRTALFVALCLVAFLIWRAKPKKKKLVYTARVRRLLAVYALTIAAFAALAAFAITQMERILGEAPMRTFWWVMVVQLGLVCLPPLWLALSARIAQPVEQAISRRYFRQAQRKLAAIDGLIKIGITGSYGKTSVKMILATILSEKFKTYATPHSYNTPMGVTRVIREQLDDSYDVFIAEMGARQIGDIAEMCDLVRPDYGILTSVGPQHLETFGSLENVAKGKYELVEHTNPKGAVFLPADGGICQQLYQKAPLDKGLFGIGEGPDRYMWADGIIAGPQGSSFTLHSRDGGSVACQTKLLGRHNVMNITGCAAMAYKLGMLLEDIAAGIAKVQPVEHRLELIPTANGVAVIDDAFNSNPAGTRAALDVLATFPGRKIVVTPGLVELGDAQEEENRAFGQAMAAVADIAILVAGNAPSIRQGLLDGGFDADHIVVTGSLEQASAALGGLTRAGDVVLFENDLPDHYEK